MPMNPTVPMLLSGKEASICKSAVLWLLQFKRWSREKTEELEHEDHEEGR